MMYGIRKDASVVLAHIITKLIACVTPLQVPDIDPYMSDGSFSGPGVNFL